MHGFELLLLPVTHPGVEQKATWLQIRQQRPGLRVPLGLGRDELDVDQGGGRHRLPAREDVRRVVVGRRARRPGRRRWREGLQLAWRCSTAREPDQGAQGHPEARPRQGPGHRSEGGSRRGALQPWPDVGDAHRRRRAAAQERYGKGKSVRRRAGALGPGEPGARPTQRRSARLRRSHAPGVHHLRRPHGRGLGAHPHLGRREVVLHVRLVPGRRVDHQAAGEQHAAKYATEKKITPRTPAQCQS